MSPVGQTLAHIAADGSGATLTAADQQEYRALSRREPDPAARWAGRCRSHGLRYWIPAAPAPGNDAATVTRDAAGRLSLLQQDGWSVRYAYPDRRRRRPCRGGWI